MLARSAKSKGRLLQVWTKKNVLETFPILDEEDVKSTTMGERGVDIQLTKLARSYFPYGVECKNLKQSAIYKPYEQATRNTFLVSPNLEPVLIIKGNHKRPLAVIDAEHFFKLVRARYDASIINLNRPDKDAPEIQQS
jgi:hypothetical protein